MALNKAIINPMRERMLLLSALLPMKAGELSHHHPSTSFSARTKFAGETSVPNSATCCVYDRGLFLAQPIRLCVGIAGTRSLTMTHSRCIEIDYVVLVTVVRLCGISQYGCKFCHATVVRQTIPVIIKDYNATMRIRFSGLFACCMHALRLFS